MPLPFTSDRFPSHQLLETTSCMKWSHILSAGLSFPHLTQLWLGRFFFFSFLSLLFICVGNISCSELSCWFISLSTQMFYHVAHVSCFHHYFFYHLYTLPSLLATSISLFYHYVLLDEHICITDHCMIQFYKLSSYHWHSQKDSLGNGPQGQRNRTELAGL